MMYVRSLLEGMTDAFLLWLVQLTVGEKREMGSCEKERADFKQEADHPSHPPFCLPNSEIAAQYLFCPRSRVRPRVRPLASIPRLCPSYSPSTANTMLFGPLGPSLAPYVRSSRTLSKWLQPLATWYANLSGYRRVGLVYDDLRASLSLSSPPPNSVYHPHRLSALVQSIYTFF